MNVVSVDHNDSFPHVKCFALSLDNTNDGYNPSFFWALRWSINPEPKDFDFSYGADEVENATFTNPESA